MASNYDNGTKASQKEQTKVSVLILMCPDVLALSKLPAEGVAKTCYNSTIWKWNLPHNIVPII